MNRREMLGVSGAYAAMAMLPGTARAEGPVSAEAARLYERAIVFDANLVPPLQDKFPYPKELLDMAARSGVTAMKTSLGGFSGNFEDTVAEIGFYMRAFEAYPGTYLQVRGHADFTRAKAEKRMGVILSFESVEMLDGKVERIDLFRGLGVRVMQLSYNKASPFGTGVLGDPKAGLTELGREAVAAMNRLGVAIDLSHSNEATTTDVIKASALPVLVTHAGCAAVYDNPRNKPDAVLRAVADKGGVVGIFDLVYLAPSPRQPTLDDYIAHMTHALNICGEDHVGIGSDSTLAPWDTSPEATAAFEKDEEARRKAGVAAPGEDGRPLYVIGLNTPRRSEIIADALLKRGYKPPVVEKVLGRNFTDALGRIWKD
jgi:membrane dipeptidase